MTIVIEIFLEYTTMAIDVGETFSSELTKTLYVTENTIYYIEVDVMLTDLESSDEYLDIALKEMSGRMKS